MIPLSSAWSWIPPCHVWSTFARRWNCLVVGVCASKVCTQTAFCTFRQALLCSASRDRALVCSGSSCFRRHPSQVINLSTDTIVPAAVPAASCLGLAVSASASGARSPPKLSETRLSSRECVRRSLLLWPFQNCYVVRWDPALIPDFVSHSLADAPQCCTCVCSEHDVESDSNVRGQAPASHGLCCLLVHGTQLCFTRRQRHQPICGTPLDDLSVGGYNCTGRAVPAGSANLPNLSLCTL